MQSKEKGDPQANQEDLMGGEEIILTTRIDKKKQGEKNRS